MTSYASHAFSQWLSMEKTVLANMGTITNVGKAYLDRIYRTNDWRTDVDRTFSV